MKKQVWLQQAGKRVLILLLCFTISGAELLLAQDAKESSLFASDEILELKLSGNIKDALRDRSAKPAKYSATISYETVNKTTINLPIRLQARGNFRKQKDNCRYPPLWIHFGKTVAKKRSIFSLQKKMKLVMPCQDDEDVVKEWLVYKLYNLFTPMSFRARLVKVSWQYSSDGKVQGPYYGMLLEEDKQLANRNDMVEVKHRLTPQHAQQLPFLEMSVFEYLIGNTDWSCQFLHNIKLLAADSVAVPFTVPYDFDHAGIISTDYAHPAEMLDLSSVRERRYRGFCVADLRSFEPVIKKFKNMKKDIYALYNNCELLNKRYLKFVNRYLDDFFETLDKPKEWQDAFTYPCKVEGSGNVIIKGLNNN